MSNVNENGHTYYPKYVYNKDGSFKIVASSKEEDEYLKEMTKSEEKPSEQKKDEKAPPWPVGDKK